MNDDDFERREAEQALEEALLLLKQQEEGNQDAALAAAAKLKAEPPLCSFCGKGINQVRRLIEGQRGHICDSCIRACCALMQNPG